LLAREAWAKHRLDGYSDAETGTQELAMAR